MPDIIKVGITEYLDRRIRELDNTSTPLPFESYYAVETNYNIFNLIDINTSF